MNEIQDLQTQFHSALAGNKANEQLFDQVADTVYFLKDAAGRYMSVNQTLVERCGLTSKQELIGRTALDVFPDPLGGLIAAQDQQVLTSGKSIRAKLELHLYVHRREGWCLTWKEPLRDQNSEIIGLSGISRDLQTNAGASSDIASLSETLKYIQENIDQPLRLPDLARMAGLSGYQLDQRIRTLFGLTAGQYITRARIDHACHLLRQSSASISAIALDCGYGDKAAFTRQFRQSVGLTPASFRKS